MMHHPLCAVGRAATWIISAIVAGSLAGCLAVEQRTDAVGRKS
jgi:hypothetical protein